MFPSETSYSHGRCLHRPTGLHGFTLHKTIIDVSFSNCLYLAIHHLIDFMRSFIGLTRPRCFIFVFFHSSPNHGQAI